MSLNTSYVMLELLDASDTDMFDLYCERFDELVYKVIVDKQFDPAGSAVLYTDGSGTTSKFPGGWAYVWFYDDDPEKLYKGSGGEEYTTNNRMELTAIIEGLKSIKMEKGLGNHVLVTTDSQYCERGINQWLHSWHRSGKLLNVKNADLWCELFKYTMFNYVEASWIRGHFGNKFNEECDKEAGRQRKIILDKKNCNLEN